MLKSPLIQLILIQIREFYREPGVIFWSLLFPILMAWGLGIAFSQKAETTKTVALIANQQQFDEDIQKYFPKVDLEYKQDSISLTYFYGINYGNEFIGVTHYRIEPVNWQKAELMVKRGETPLILSVNEGRIEYHFDKQSSEAQLAYLQLLSIFNGVDIEQQQWEIKPMTEKGTRYIDFLIPGLLAMNIMMSTMWGISYTLIEARTKKLLRRMVATPMPKWQYILSLFIARVILCVVEALIVFSFAYYYFNITISGSFLALAVLFFSGLVAFAGIAVLVGSRTAKTQIGNGLINFIVMPMMLLSGIYFSYHNFPEFVVPYIQALPLTMLADGVKAIFNENAGIAEVWKYIVVLNALGLATFAIGLRFFKWY